MPIRSRVRRILQRGADALLPRELPLMDQVVRKNLDRCSMYCRAMEYINFERVEGDVLEFGVFGGISLALLARAQQMDPKGMHRRVAGFDSFSGLPESVDTHERWKTGDCATMHSWHPTLAVGDPVTPQATFDLFERCGLPRPEIEAGAFDETLQRVIPEKYARVALLHVDCDLYESTRIVLDRVAPVLQPGSMVLFDDWFHYQGNPARGEAKAFDEFLRDTGWKANHYGSYATFGNAFILYRDDVDGLEG